MRLIGIFAVLALAAGGVQQAFAADTYAAIAFSQANGHYGYGNKFRTRTEAEEKALQECGPGCKVVLWIRSQCGGMASGKGRGYGTFLGANERIVGDGSIAACEQRTSGCELRVAVCSAR